MRVGRDGEMRSGCTPKNTVTIVTTVTLWQNNTLNNERRT